MEDRFKFRVWDKKTALMREVHSLHLGTNKVIVSSIYGNVSIKLSENVILMQCTGLKDKNGRLIYEGDIVKINGDWNAAGPAGYEENICVVKSDNCTTGFTPMCNYDCDCGVYHYADLCEVIGNIYENPELLEK